MKNFNLTKGTRKTFRRFFSGRQNINLSDNQPLLILFTLFFSTFSMPALCQDLLGEGTSGSPYIIKSKTDMDKLADFVNEGGSTNGNSTRYLPITVL